MAPEKINELKRIIEHYIPLGNDKSIYHVGICSIKRCSRCQDAIKIRELINTLEIEGHIGK